ncbi:MAG: isochorismatase family protein [Thermoleophilaceae bacterium]
MARALLIVDYQNDFTPPEGALAVPEGDRIADRLNELAGDERFDLVVATRDWHPPDHSSFEREGGRWPEHCVRDTEGAELHPALDRSRVDVVLDKGQHRDTEGYSAFERPDLHRLLRKRGIDSLTVAGLATDVCVRASALDALERGYGVEVDPEATRGVDRADRTRALDQVRERGGTVVGEG